jgi:hypothetical protein
LIFENYNLKIVVIQIIEKRLIYNQKFFFNSLHSRSGKQSIMINQLWLKYSNYVIVHIHQECFNMKLIKSSKIFLFNNKKKKNFFFSFQIEFLIHHIYLYHLVYVMIHQI